MKKVILVAAHLLTGGVRNKDESVTEAELGAGEELTAAKQKALGLDKDEVAGLVEKGALIEVNAVATDAGDFQARLDKAEGDARQLDAQVSKLTTDLAAANDRATEAEGRVAQLEKDLAAAKVPAKG